MLRKIAGRRDDEGENVHSKSLRTYIEKYPQLKGVRLSMLPYHDQDWMTNYPLYCVNFI